MRRCGRVVGLYEEDGSVKVAGGFPGLDAEATVGERGNNADVHSVISLLMLTES